MRYLFPLLVAAGPALAGLPVVEAVEATPQGEAWRFDVTVSHGDTGWDHYADGWEVLGPDGARLGYRELLHPHVEEQPFTRSLGGVQIPDGVDTVTVRAHDNVDGWGDAVEVPLR
ncbi:MAG: hypothetical protein AAF390_07435 [Pseudomonadota bacterium]